jgi:hypothetical protein
LWTQFKLLQFGPIEWLESSKSGPRALHEGPTQAFPHPTWRPTWHKNGAKPLGRPKGIGSRFGVAQFLNMGPIASSSFLHSNWVYTWVQGLYILRPNCGPKLCKMEAQLYLINWVRPQCKAPLIVNPHKPLLLPSQGVVCTPPSQGAVCTLDSTSAGKRGPGFTQGSTGLEALDG